MYDTVDASHDIIRCMLGGLSMYWQQSDWCAYAREHANVWTGSIPSSCDATIWCWCGVGDWCGVGVIWGGVTHRGKGGMPGEAL